MNLRRNHQGQMLAEFSLTLLLVMIPLIGGGAWWLKLEWSRIQCANSTFKQARRQLIQTGREVRLSQTCGEGRARVSENIHLLPLESLDQNKGALSIGDVVSEGSQLLDSLSSSWQQLQDSGSERSSTESKL